MADGGIQIVSNENGEPTAVIVPIELWREIESERETAFLLKSEAMKHRLLQAARRQTGLSFDDVIERLVVGPDSSIRRIDSFTRSTMTESGYWLAVTTTEPLIVRDDYTSSWLVNASPSGRRNALSAPLNQA